MSEAAFLHALRLEIGDVYDLRHLQSRLDFLWTLGIFEEIEFEARTLPSGPKVLSFRVRELPAVQSITFDDTATLVPEIALDRFNELVLGVRTGTEGTARLAEAPDC